MKDNALKYNNIEDSQRLQYHSKLKYYKLVDEVHNLDEGEFIRWIKLGNNKLMTGALVCSIDFTEHGVLVKCKSFSGLFFDIHFDKNIIFQKMTNDEIVFIGALNSLKQN